MQNQVIEFLANNIDHVIKGIIGLLFFIYGIYRPFRVRFILKRSEETDPIWKNNVLLCAAEKAFYLIHESLAKRDSAVIGDFVTDHMFKLQQREIDELIANKQLYKYASIKISKMDIIGCENYKDNVGDNYSVNIIGEMISYITDESKNEFIHSHPSNLRRFNCILDFYRDSDGWYLHDFFEDCTEDDITVSGLYLEN